MKRALLLSICAVLAFACSKENGGEKAAIAKCETMTSSSLAEKSDKFSKIALAVRLKASNDNVKAKRLATESFEEGCGYAALILAQWDEANAKEYLSKAQVFDGEYKNAIRAELAFLNLNKLQDLETLDEKTIRENIATLEDCATQNEQSAAFHLRSLYSGKSKYADPSKVHRYNLILSKISSQGYAYEYECALDYFNGRGTQQDKQKAAEIFSKLYSPLEKSSDFTFAEKNSSVTNNRLAIAAKAGAGLAYLYAHGDGIEKDAKKSGTIKNKLLSVGNFSHLQAVSEMFSDTFGRSIEFVKSAEDEKFYASNADIFRKKHKERLNSEIETVEKEIAAAKMKSMDELKKGSSPVERVLLAEKYMAINKTEAPYPLDYHTVTIVTFDAEKFPEGLKFLQREAADGNPFAALSLGKLYIDGNYKLIAINGPVDYDENLAKKYFHDVLKSDNALLASEAYYYLGKIAAGYHREWNDKMNNEDDAVEFYTKSAKLNYTPAANILHNLYHPYSSGHFSRTNYATSFHWAEAGADKDPELALHVAGEFLNGTFFEKNFEKAGEYFLKAANLYEDEIAKSDESLYMMSNKAYAVECYARMCELGLIKGKSGEDAEEIRKRHDMKDYDTTTGICRAYYGILADEKKSRLMADISDSNWRIETSRENQKMPVKELDKIEQVKALPNLNDEKIQFALGLLYIDAAYSYMRKNLPKESDLFTEYGKKCLSAASNSGIKEAAVQLAVVAMRQLDRYNTRQNRGELVKELENSLENIANTDDEDLLFKTLRNDNFSRLKIPMISELIKKYADKSKKFRELYLNDLLENGRADELYAELEKNDADGADIYLKNLMGLIEYYGNSNRPPEIEKSMNFFKTNADDIGNFMLFHIYSEKENSADAKKYSLKFKGFKDYGNLSLFIQHAEKLISEKQTDDLRRSLTMLKLASDEKSVYSNVSLYDIPIPELEKMTENDAAQYKVAYHFARSNYRTNDYAKSYGIVKKLHEKDPQTTKYIYALWYFTKNGLGVEKDEAKAEAYLDTIFQMAESENVDALKTLCKVLDVNYNQGDNLWIDNNFATKDDKIAERAEALLNKNLDIFSVAALKNELLESLGGFYMWRGKNKAKGAEFYEAAIANGTERIESFLTDYYRDTKQYEKLIAYYENRIQKGLRISTIDYALIYIKGIGVEKDYKKAIEILNSDLEDSDYIPIETYAWLYVMYSNGWGVEKNPEKLQEIFDRIINSGNAHSLWWVGQELLDGCGQYELPKDIDLGVKMVKKSAELNDSSAYRTYAKLLQEGIGVEKDHALAIEYFIKFGEARGLQDDFWGYADAIRLYRHSDTSKDFNKAFKLATHWLEKSPNSPHAHTIMGVLYLYGVGCEQSDAKAFEYFQKAVSLPTDRTYSDQAYAALILCYQDGIGTEKDDAKAAELVEKMHPITWNRCGSYTFFDIAMNFKKGASMYDDLAFIGFKPDDEKVKFWLDVFLEHGKIKKHKDDLKKLIKFYREEDGFKNEKKALEIESILNEMENKAK